ncbi:hypothetical protein PBRA_006920 [Plasmodiophora brassicae]|uniref:Uncharacterized protein n=1 Tax=Plasmodiophora brassicae TaxID=37360 RepID=A0A0G4IUN5_PLABS|nr:hypothetical protein PBRA_006920 [Plasmodiophora brassicae]
MGDSRRGVDGVFAGGVLGDERDGGASEAIEKRDQDHDGGNGNVRSTSCTDSNDDRTRKDYLWHLPCRGKVRLWHGARLSGEIVRNQ